MNKMLVASLIAVILCTPVCAKSWRGITPLRSTRSDVETVLGKPVRYSNHWATYYTDTDAISILYSDGLRCGTGANSEWNVPAGRVVSITVSSKVIVPFSSLNLDESKYRKSADPHMLTASHYSNMEEGEFITVVNGEVKGVDYTADAASNHLKCSNIRSKPTSVSAYKFDEYGNLQLADEQSRLDNFAITLTQTPGSTGYIYGYSGGTISPSNARLRVRRTRNYLTSVRGLKPSRVVALYVGRRSDFTIELHIAPKVEPKLLHSARR